MDLVFPPDIGFYTNQLLIQMYTEEAACTIADLPDFKLMVITAGIVICLSEGKNTIVKRAREFTMIWD